MLNGDYKHVIINADKDKHWTHIHYGDWLHGPAAALHGLYL
jgi:hypothetical protein